MHWTYSFILIYSLFAFFLFLIRIWFVHRRWKGLKNPDVNGPDIHFRVRSRLGIAGTVLLLIATVFLYLGGVYFPDTSWGHICDIAGMIILTIAMAKIRIWPWSLAEVTLTNITHPKFCSAMGQDKLTWWKFPDVEIIRGRVVLFYGSKGSQAAEHQEVKISQGDLGKKVFEQFKSCLKTLCPGRLIER